eukprot:TRINITY_DN5825_c1_g1_i1.p1 TRINITY_DN5825_c1_g1~~TRINITY_DN5825_c1_g1_i1.p1  ORF type:complete len:328 (+),score=60.78 TRINITY_DN5825_c1_g1_i1:53-1036(+)
MALPAVIVDSHMHYIDTEKNDFQAFLKSVGAPCFQPEDYTKEADGLSITKAVHVEAIPDDGLAEANWVASLVRSGRAPQVAAIVAAVNLADDDAAEQLDRLKAIEGTPVRGIRYILDYDGPFNGGENATHVACKRDNLDFLRDPTAAAKFERGFALLAEKGLSFDLQCCPAQLPAAAALCARHPDVRVCIDHLGKPRKLNGDDGEADRVALKQWREGMKLMAAQPQVYIKLSMLGFAVPGWSYDEKKEAFIKGLVREVIDLFGARRCMFNSNWHINAVASNSDFADPDCGDLTMKKLYGHFQSWVSDLSSEDQDLLFAGSATDFYRL